MDGAKRTKIIIGLFVDGQETYSRPLWLLCAGRRPIRYQACRCVTTTPFNPPIEPPRRALAIKAFNAPT